MKKVRYITIGCRVNQYEIQGMRESLEQAGYTSTRERAENVHFVVINTCTVTQHADRESKYWVRRSRREHPDAKIVVTGCAVERNVKEFETIPEVDLVLGNRHKADISSLIEGCAAPAVQDRFQFTPLSISRSEGKARAFIKIQDGCNHACSFCKVVLVRGRSRSRELADILEEVKRVRDHGYTDVVFAGIQLGAYGWDLSGSRDALVEVLEATSKIDGIERIRLSSIEPTDVRPTLIEALSTLPKCCPHLHIPLQSGDNEILDRMNRRYDRDFYRELITGLRTAMPNFELSLDVMVGFPGEEEKHFQNTRDLLQAVEPVKCHVFPYSSREGTRAARLQDTSAEVKKSRVQTLMGFAEQLSLKRRLRYVGQILPVLVELVKDDNRVEDLLLQGLTPNYMRVYFKGKASWERQIMPVRILSVQGDRMLGEVIHA